MPVGVSATQVAGDKELQNGFPEVTKVFQIFGNFLFVLHFSLLLSLKFKTLKKQKIFLNLSFAF